MCALELERGDAEAVTFDAVIAAPGVELDRALGINAISFFQRGRDLGGLAEHRDIEPLHGVIFADTDAQAHPRLAGLRCARISVGGEEAMKGTLNAHGARSSAIAWRRRSRQRRSRSRCSRILAAFAARSFAT